MNIEYYPDVDVLRIELTEMPFQADGMTPEADDDLVLYYDEGNRLSEIEVSRASERADLAHLRRSADFTEITESDMQVRG